MLGNSEDDHVAREVGHYIRRAREERVLATNTRNRQVADAHLDRAKRYEAMISQARAPLDGYGSAAGCDCVNFAMSSQRLFPFHARRPLLLRSSA